MRSRSTLIIALVSFALAGATCPKPVPRGGGSGSARWALAIAQPSIAAFAPDVQLRSVFGASVSLDGRLPANTGNWSFVAWSPSRAQTIQVTVDASGAPSSTTRAEAAPGPGVQIPLPAAWVDSTTAFAAIAGQTTGSTIANLMVLNAASYRQAAGQAVWGMTFDGSTRNQLVKWDGTYLGPE